MSSLQERIAAFAADKAAGYTPEQIWQRERGRDEEVWVEHVREHGNPGALPRGRHEPGVQKSEKSESEKQRQAQKQIVKEMLMEIVEEILGEWKAKSREEGT